GHLPGGRPDAVDVERVTEQLRGAVRAELVTAGARPGEYWWRHDQLRLAVLGGAGKGLLAGLRLAAGRALSTRPDRMFEAVSHLNAAIELVPRATDGRRLA